MGRFSAALVACLMLTLILPPTLWAASGDPGDVTGYDSMVTDTTWTGEVKLARGVAIEAGVTLTISAADVQFQTSEDDHFGLQVRPGAKLVVRDSHLHQAKDELGDNEQAKRHWALDVMGVLDVENSLIRHASDINFQYDSVGGSRIVSSELAWMSRGIHLARTNLTDTAKWDLELVDVTLHDIPNYGGGLSDIGGGLGILNANVRADGLTIERIYGTGIFVDRSTVAVETGQFGNRVDLHDVTIITGNPRPGGTGQSSALELRTLGSFVCDTCRFISDNAGAMISDGLDVVFRDTTFVNTQVYLNCRYRPTPVHLDGVLLAGPGSYFVSNYGSDCILQFDDVAFDAHEDALGFFIFDETPIDARGIFWGDAAGPQDDEAFDGSAPVVNAGNGRRIFGPIDYRDWASAAPARINPLDVDASALPTRVVPGQQVSADLWLTSRLPEAAAWSLSVLGDTPAVVTPESFTLTPGVRTQVSVTWDIPAAATLDSPLPLSLAATSGAATTALVHSALVVPDRTRIQVDAPSSGGSVGGQVELLGHLDDSPAVTASQTEGSSTPPASPPPSADHSAENGADNSAGNVQPSSLGSADRDGDRIDDRLQAAPGVRSIIVSHDGRATTQRALTSAIEAAGGTLIRHYTLLDATWAMVDVAFLAALAQTAGVRDIWWDEPTHANLAIATRAVHARAGDDGVPFVWSGDSHSGFDGLTGEGVLVAVIDSGVDETHDSLDDMDDDPLTIDRKVVDHLSTAAVLATQGGRVGLPAGVITPGEHGTAVAGTVAGTGAGSSPHGNHAGVAPGARILDVDAFEELPIQPVDERGITLLPSGVGLALEGFQAVADWNRNHPEQPAQIAQISLSIGTAGPDHPLNVAADALAASGVLVVVAAGNSGRDVEAPASARKVLAVGAVATRGTATTEDDHVAAFSSRGSATQVAQGIRKPDLVAPGTDIMMPLALSRDGYQARDGTSFSAPLTSGVAALVWEANPALHAAQVKEILIRAALPKGLGDGSRYTDADLDFEDDAPDGGWDARWGHGYLDAAEAVRLALNTPARLPPTPPETTLFALPTGLANNATSGLTMPTTSPASWTLAPGHGGLVIGDGQQATTDTAILVVAAPAAAPEASVWTAVASLYADDVEVARTSYNDNSIKTNSQINDPRIPLRLGAWVGYNVSGPDGGALRLLRDFDVLDSHGDVLVPDATSLRLELSFNQGGADTVILQGEGGTRLILPTDPSTLPDTSVPTRVPSLRIAGASPTQAILTWGPAGDDTGIGGYQVARDGAVVASLDGDARTWTDTINSPASYQLRALDLHAKTGAWSDPVAFLPPGAAGRDVIVSTGSLALRATDGAGDNSFATWRAALPMLPTGRHVIQASVFEDGNQVDATTVVVDQRPPDNVPPTIALGSLPPLLHGTFFVPVELGDVDGADDIATVEWRIDNAPWARLSHQPDDAVVLPLDATALVDGNHDLQVRAQDQSGATTTASANLVSAAWQAQLTAPPVWAEDSTVAVHLGLTGSQSQTATPVLRVGTAALPMTSAENGWTVDVPAGESGLLALSVWHNDQRLAQTTRIVDAPPQAVLVGPRDGTRLDALAFADASLDDEAIDAWSWLIDGVAVHDGPYLAISPGALAVGDHVIRLDVTNRHGLSAGRSQALAIHNLAPRISTPGPHVNGNPVAVIYSGETVTWPILIDDPEGDALGFTGGFASPDEVQSATLGQSLWMTRPTSTGNLSADISVADAWDTTTYRHVVEILPNMAPTARLAGPTIVAADTPVTYDASLSTDPDRGWLQHNQTISGVGSQGVAVSTWRLPMGTYALTHTVTDSSGATDSVQMTVQADDWLSAHAVTTTSDDLAERVVLRLTATWHDGSPAANAQVSAVVTWDVLGETMSQQVLGSTDDHGVAVLLLPRDTPLTNLPGPHTVRTMVTHDSLAAAPIQDVESVTTTTSYTL